MKRRSFLGALGAAVTGGPKVIASALPKSVTDLSLHTMGVALTGAGLSMDNTPRAGANIDWAKHRLADIIGRSEYARAIKYRQHHVYSMDVDTASLRSLSLSAKMARSKRIQFIRQEENERSYLQGVIDGWFKD